MALHMWQHDEFGNKKGSSWQYAKSHEKNILTLPTLQAFECSSFILGHLTKGYNNEQMSYNTTTP